MQFTLEDYKKDTFRKQLLDSINSFEDLQTKWWHRDFLGSTPLERRKQKIAKAFNQLVSYSHPYYGLELGFALGTSVGVLLERYDGFVLDLLDFNNDLKKISDILKLHYKERIRNTYFCSSADMKDIESSKYEFVNSQSFFEHLPNDVYWDTLKEIYRVLKPGGALFVYVDQTVGKDNPEHIRVKPFNTIRKEIESIGFEAHSDFFFYKPAEDYDGEQEWV